MATSTGGLDLSVPDFTAGFGVTAPGSGTVPGTVTASPGGTGTHPVTLVVSSQGVSTVTKPKAKAAPKAKVADCTPIHPDVPVLGAIEGAMCAAFTGAGITKGTDPTAPIQKNVGETGKNLLDAATNASAAGAKGSKTVKDATALGGAGLDLSGLLPVLMIGGLLLLVVLMKR